MYALSNGISVVVANDIDDLATAREVVVFQLRKESEEFKNRAKFADLSSYYPIVVAICPVCGRTIFPYKSDNANAIFYCCTEITVPINGASVITTYQQKGREYLSAKVNLQGLIAKYSTPPDKPVFEKELDVSGKFNAYLFTACNSHYQATGCLITARQAYQVVKNKLVVYIQDWCKEQKQNPQKYIDVMHKMLSSKKARIIYLTMRYKHQVKPATRNSVKRELTIYHKYTAEYNTDDLNPRILGHKVVDFRQDNSDLRTFTGSPIRKSYTTRKQLCHDMDHALVTCDQWEREGFSCDIIFENNRPSLLGDVLRFKVVARKEK